MDLYSFFNSSASFRLRIALGLKGVPFDFHAVNIRHGMHREAQYVETVNASASVPALLDGDFSLGQSLAIIDWLDARFPDVRLIPTEPEKRARVLELSYLIACDIHPVNNLRVLNYLTTQLQITPEQKATWYAHWITEGMASVERLLHQAQRAFPGLWCFGEAPTLADCCLIPQIANAQRMNCDLSAYPLANAIHAYAMQHPTFVAAAPQNQPDFVG